MTTPSATTSRASLPSQLRWFVVIGLICTGAFAVLYSGLRWLGFAALDAKALALLMAVAASFAANRRFTFETGDGSALSRFSLGGSDRRGSAVPPAAG